MAKRRVRASTFRQLSLTIAAVFLAMPLAHAAIKALTTRDVDRASAAFRARDDALATARAFVPSPPDIASLDLRTSPNDARPFPPDRLIECTYVPKAIKGTTPKFDCALQDGEVIKIKYGGTPERSGEVAATRLLAALGFGADHVTFVEKVRCFGCPPSPFLLRQVLEQWWMSPILDRSIDYTRSRDFQWVTVERRMEGQPIEVENYSGWGWYDLKRIDPARGGASRSEVDALRLMALFLVHWDNKDDNQRLVCLDARPLDPGRVCRESLVILQDVGATFGPTKVRYERWMRAPLWADRQTCQVTMESMPYHGGTFVPVTISEGGRQLLASKLKQLSDAQILALFAGARFPDPKTGDVPAADLTPWVEAFLARVRLIADGPPCPSQPAQ